MIVKWLRVSAEGMILSSGQASPDMAALQRQAQGERVFIHDAPGDVDDTRLMADLTDMILIPSAPEHVGAPGVGVALIEIT